MARIPHYVDRNLPASPGNFKYLLRAEYYWRGNLQLLKPDVYVPSYCPDFPPKHKTNTHKVGD